jgi:glycopeptide antibiotics resistance protein
VLSTLLVHLPWLAFSVLIGVVVLGPFAGMWLRERSRTTSALLAVAVLGIVVLTLYPEGDPYPGIACSVALPYLAPTAVESIANIVLFVPVAFLAALRWRRPLVAVLGASTLSAIIEGVQALVPVIGRACDTSDWITNSIGAVIGGVVAFGALAWYRHRVARATDHTSAASLPAGSLSE